MMKNVKKLFFLLAIFILFPKGSVFATKLLNIAFVGDFGSGKTQLRSVVSGSGYSFLRKPTLYADRFSIPIRFGDDFLMCNLYDTSGNERVRNSIITKRLKEVNIVVIALDCSEVRYAGGVEESVERCFDEWIRVVRMIQPTPYILVAITKADGDMLHWIESFTQSMEALKNGYNRFDYVFTSALKGLNGNIGDVNAGNDFGNNFWGKIRTILRKEELIDELPEWNNLKIFEGGKDDVSKKCILL